MAGLPGGYRGRRRLVAWEETGTQFVIIAARREMERSPDAPSFQRGGPLTAENNESRPRFRPQAVDGRGLPRT